MTETTNSQEHPSSTGEQSEEYVRVPIPDAVLYEVDGREIDLRLAVQAQAFLLVFASPTASDFNVAQDLVRRSRPRLSRIGVRLVTPVTSAKTERDLVSLVDPLSRVRHVFLSEAVSGTGAVLLGTDGLLAGGPVAGILEVEAFVSQIESELATGFPAAEDESTPAPEGPENRSRPHEAHGLVINERTLAISCKCITYGRVEFLEEALQSFLTQDYAGDHELVIVNDYPLQRLSFDHPRVRIINLDFTFRTIGEKENFAVSACRYETIAVWDDDDIALPNHLDNINAYLPGHDILHWQRGAAVVGSSIEGLHSLGNSGIVYTRDLWERVGGHAFENAGYDVTFVNRAHEAGARFSLAEPEPRHVSWFYCWGNGSYHMSGQGTDDGSRPDVVTRHSDHIEQLRRAGHIPTGEITLTPRWRKDYVQLLTDYCAVNEPDAVPS
jgi:Glycosyl transferase family 2